MPILKGTVHSQPTKRNSWGVGTLKTSTGYVTIVGVGVGDLNRGDTVEVDGTPTTHRVYGPQFKVTAISRIEDGPHPGFRTWLLRAKIHPPTATKWAAMLDRAIGPDPAIAQQALSEILASGLPATLRTKPVTARLAIDGVTAIATATRQLGPHGFSAALRWLSKQLNLTDRFTDDKPSPQTAEQIPEAVMEQFAETLVDDPYEILLCDCGFREADGLILRNEMIDPMSFVRVRRIVDELLLDMPDTLYTLDALQRNITREFGLDASELLSDEAMTNLAFIDDQTVQHTLMHTCETHIVKQLQFVRTQHSTDLPVLDDAVLNAGLAVTLTPEQNSAVREAIKHPVTILTGAAGTGKSTTAKALINALAACTGNAIILAAPTNKAARRLAQQTGRPAVSIHRMLGATPSSTDARQTSEFGLDFNFQRDRADPFRDTILLLDECSMISTRLMASVLDAVDDRCRIILMGDEQQLPPIAEGQPFTDLLRVVPTITLTKILRANPGLLLTNQHAIRNGAFDQIQLETRSADWEFIAADDDAEIAATLVDRAKALYDTHKDPYAFQIITPRRSGHALSAYTLNSQFRHRALGASTSAFVTGDKGLCVRRLGAEDGMVNGDFFRVVQPPEKIADHLMWVMPEIPTSEAAKKGFSLERNHDALEFGWAATVHKYQGCEAPVILIPLAESFGNFVTRNMLYTAISRARKKVILVGQASAFYDALHRTESARRTGLLQKFGVEVPVPEDFAELHDLHDLE